jgi:hypothetical protein
LEKQEAWNKLFIYNIKLLEIYGSKLEVRRKMNVLNAAKTRWLVFFFPIFLPKLQRRKIGFRMRKNSQMRVPRNFVRTIFSGHKNWDWTDLKNTPWKAERNRKILKNETENTYKRPGTLQSKVFGTLMTATTTKHDARPTWCLQVNADEREVDAVTN